MKVAVCFASKPFASITASTSMAKSMCLHPTHETAVFPIEGGAFSSVKTSERFSSVSMLRKSDTGNLLLVSGVPLDLHGSLDERLNRIVFGGFKAAVNELKKLDGAFAAFFWDADEKKMVVVTDPLGLQPLYVSRTSKGLLLATEIKAFPASGLVDIEMDPSGWGAFIGLAHSVGERTQLAGVHRFPPATVMTFDPSTGNEENEVYWHWPKLRENMQMKDVDTDAIIGVLRSELNAYAQHKKSSTVLLSGGFDSRLAIAMMHQEGWDPTALIIGHQDELFGADAILAKSVVKRLGLRSTLVNTPRDFYRTSSYLDYLVMNEVATPSLYLFIAQVMGNVDPSMEVIWDGTPPGYGLVPAFLPPGGFDQFLKHSFRPRDAYVWKMADLTFGATRTDEMFEEVTASIQRESDKYPDNEMGVTMFEVYNRMRTRTSPNALKVYSNHAMPYMLSMSREFWDIVGQIPYSVSKAYELYFEIYRKHFPNLAQVPFLSGGGLWCDQSCGLRGVAAKGFYWGAKSKFTQLSQKAYRRYIRGSRRYWMESQFLSQTRDKFEWDHTDLNVDGIRNMDLNCRLPFYWQMWQWILSGDLTTRNSNTFFS
ncbi:MAG: hypothetical protein JRG71_00725 [Deltaproteobacteria bacterium]|nr:hypothetical protein [Deltaproteobacteria bacterium]